MVDRKMGAMDIRICYPECIIVWHRNTSYLCLISCMLYARSIKTTKSGLVLIVSQYLKPLNG